MGRAGILEEDERVELLGGEIIVMSAIGNRHAACVLRMTSALNVSRLTGRAFVQVQNPVAADRMSEPQPDLMLLAHRDDHYDFAHPGPEDVLLLVEVADSSLLYDRVEKAPRYATARIPEAWLVDVSGETVTVYGGPGPDGYSEERLLRRGDEIRSVAVAGLRLPVDEIFGARP